jgi:hypothetical protein
MSNSTIERCSAWIHWVKQEKESDEDRLLMANDIEKLLEVAKACNKFLSDPNRYERTMLRDSVEEVYKK